MLHHLADVTIQVAIIIIIVILKRMTKILVACWVLLHFLVFFDFKFNIFKERTKM